MPSTGPLRVLSVFWPSTSHTTACATITRSPSKVTAGPSCSRYPSSSASLTRRQKAESSGPVRTR